MPTVYTVTLATDTNSGGGGTQDMTIANAGDLRYCLTQADSGPGNSVVFGKQVAGKTIDLQAALPDVSQSMTIGPDAGVGNVTVERSNTAATNFRIFTVDSGTTVTFGAFTIQNGFLIGNPGGDGGAGIDNNGVLTLKGTTVQQNQSDDNGGGILNAGDLTLNGAKINSNQAVLGGGIYNIGTLTTPPKAVVSSVTNNQAKYGAGIYNVGGTNLSRVNFNINIASQDGGGIYNTAGGNLIIQNSTFQTNKAVGGDGGGIMNRGIATISQSTFTNNSAGGKGGAIKNDGNGFGKGLTVNGNTTTGQIQGALSAGGGISTDTGEGISFDLVNSIVAGNSTPNGNNPDVDGTFIEGSGGGPQGHNFIGNGTGGNFQNGVNGDQVGTAMSPLNPQLGPLQDNGGGIPTMKPLANSPVINAGDPANAPATDERGYNRTVTVNGNLAIDIGAVESAAPAPPVVMGVMPPAAGPTGGGNNVTIGGSGFAWATAVYFGTVPAMGFTVNTDGSITAWSPAHMAGIVDITVTTPGGISATGSADQFTYS